MTVYNLYIFSRSGVCLFYEEWSRRKLDMSASEDRKLMFGLLFSMKAFVNKLSPKPSTEGFHSFRTNAFKLHYYETPSGLRFVLNTDANAGDLRETLKYIYSQIYVPIALRNPLYTPNDPITSDLFSTALQKCIRGLPAFSS
mmetsp:Transcript_36672/g.59268  ORF Transcript_36672/g.59268 Transcript_36672/m.59268 type:complete len:142 (+) Transcript_36672:67-492(+)